MKIDEMPAGRELNALVTERVMSGKQWPVNDLILVEEARGWRCTDYLVAGDAQYINDVLPKYSTDIAAANELIEKHPDLWLDLMRVGSRQEWLWSATLHGDDEFSVSAQAETIPLVLCRVYLKANEPVS